MDEPTKKDGIWIKTNHTYQNVMINQQYANYQDGVFSKYCDISIRVLSLVQNQGIIYIHDQDNYAFYRLNGTSWDRISYCPGPAKFLASYDNSLYAFTDEYVYKYNGTSWVNIMGSTRYFCNITTIYNNQLCIFSGNNIQTSNTLNMFNGSTLTRLCNANVLDSTSTEIHIKCMVTYNGEIHMFGSTSGAYHMVLKTDSNNKYTWQTSKVPIDNDAVPLFACVFNNEIYLFYRTDFSHYYYCKYNGTTWTLIGQLSSTYYRHCISLNNHIYLVNDQKSLDMYSLPEKVYNPNTVIINKGDAQNGVHLTNMFDTSYMVGNNSNRFVSGFDDCFYFADSAFDWNAPMYYGDGSQWIKFKN